MTDERTSLALVPFDADNIDIDDIMPYADAPAGDQLNILDTRAAVLSRLSARAEMGPMADIHDIDAEEAEKRAEVDEKITPMQRRRLRAQAARARVLAQRCRDKARQYELEIMAHLSRKVDEEG